MNDYKLLNFVCNETKWHIEKLNKELFIHYITIMTDYWSNINGYSDAEKVEIVKEILENFNELEKGDNQ